MDLLATSRAVPAWRALPGAIVGEVTGDYTGDYTVDYGDPAVTDVGPLVLVDDLESLFRAHYGRLVRALTVAGGSREAAADAVQEAFVKAHLHWRRIRRYEDPVGWIRRVAINRLRDEHRRQRRKERAERRVANEGAHTTDATDVAAIAEHADTSAREVAELTSQLAGLPRQQRMAIALYYVDGMPVAEVAAAMRLSEGAVKFHLHAGRAKLREGMKRS